MEESENKESEWKRKEEGNMLMMEGVEERKRKRATNGHKNKRGWKS